MTVGERIKEARKAASLTQEKLAKMCGLATVTIRQYESDKRKPNYKQLENIANATRTPLGFFFPGLAMYESVSEAREDRVMAEQVSLLTESVQNFLASIHGERHIVKVQGTYLIDSLIVYGYGDEAVAIMEEHGEELIADTIRSVILTLSTYLVSPVKYAMDEMKKGLSNDSAKLTAQAIVQHLNDSNSNTVGDNSMPIDVS